MKNKRVFFTVSAVLLGSAFLAASSLGWLSASQEQAHQTTERKEEDEHGHEEGAVHIDIKRLEEFGVRIAAAASGELDMQLRLPGEVRVNQDAIAHVVPRVAGVATRINAGLGDRVKAGDLLAVLSSRELAEVKSAYLSALERLTLAEATHKREEDLWKKRITSEQEFLEARNGLAEARIAVREREEILHALGFDEKYLRALPGSPDQSIARYELRAPINGIITNRHITLGELVKDEGAAFIITDTSTVWVEISVYQRDLPSVKIGQTVRLEVGEATHSGTIRFIDPRINEKTRTARARIVIDNAEGTLRASQFVTALIETGTFTVPVAVPKNALVNLGEETVIFVPEGDAFAERYIVIGRTDGRMIEIISGLAPGERYVAEGGFTIKSELAKGSFGDGHAH